MTPEEEEQLHTLAGEFDEAFSKLVNDLARKAPAGIRDELIATMQDHASVYGALE